MKEIRPFDIEKYATITNFLKANPNIVILPIDKSKNIQVLNRLTYESKLKEEFHNPQVYSKLSKSPLDKELVNFNKTIKIIEPYISKSTFHQIRPQQKLKSAYGILKRHKSGCPIRPIVSAKNSITVGSENFLIKILKKIRMTYSLRSTIDFKASFLKHRDSFCEKTIIRSFDVTKLYPSVNVNYTINKIIETLYEDKQSSKFYFSDNLDEKNKISVIPKTKFRKFLSEVLQNYTCFSTPIGFFKGVVVESKTPSFNWGSRAGLLVLFQVPTLTL